MKLLVLNFNYFPTARIHQYPKDRPWAVFSQIGPIETYPSHAEAIARADLMARGLSQAADTVNAKGDKE